MPQLPENIKILSYSKKIYDRYEIIQFDNNYKKRKNKKINYLLTVDCLLDENELKNFWKWFEDDLNFGTSSFQSSFEIIREDELLEFFNYKFFETPEVEKGEGELYYLTLKLVRFVDSCSFEFLQMLNALLNLQKNLRQQNTGIEAHVACPILFQKIGVSLLNLTEMVQEHPNDYRVSRIFT